MLKTMTASPEMLSLRPKEGSILTCRGRELYLSRSAFEANARAWRRQEEVQREARIQEYVDLDEKDVFFFEDFLAKDNAKDYFSLQRYHGKFLPYRFIGLTDFCSKIQNLGYKLKTLVEKSFLCSKEIPF